MLLHIAYTASPACTQPSPLPFRCPSAAAGLVHDDAPLLLDSLAANQNFLVSVHCEVRMFSTNARNNIPINASLP